MVSVVHLLWFSFHYQVFTSRARMLRRPKKELGRRGVCENTRRRGATVCGGRVQQERERRVLYGAIRVQRSPSAQPPTKPSLRVRRFTAAGSGAAWGACSPSGIFMTTGQRACSSFPKKNVPPPLPVSFGRGGISSCCSSLRKQPPFAPPVIASFAPRGRVTARRCSGYRTAVQPRLWSSLQKRRVIGMRR